MISVRENETVLLGANDNRHLLCELGNVTISFFVLKIGMIHKFSYFLCFEHPAFVTFYLYSSFRSNPMFIS